MLAAACYETLPPNVKSTTILNPGKVLQLAVMPPLPFCCFVVYHPSVIVILDLRSFTLQKMSAENSYIDCNSSHFMFEEEESYEFALSKSDVYRDSSKAFDF